MTVDLDVLGSGTDPDETASGQVGGDLPKASAVQGHHPRHRQRGGGEELGVLTAARQPVT